MFSLRCFRITKRLRRCCRNFRVRSVLQRRRKRFLHCKAKWGHAGLAQATESHRKQHDAMSEWLDQRVPFWRPSTMQSRAVTAHPRKQLKFSGRPPNGDKVERGVFVALSVYRKVPWNAAFNSLLAEYVNPVALRLSATASIPVRCTSLELHADTALLASLL